MNEKKVVNKETDPSAKIKEEPLKGIRIGIQPNLLVRDWLTEAGSKALENYKALEDAFCVTRLREAGAVIAGSVKMSELGFGLSRDGAAEAFKKKKFDTLVLTDTLGEARYSAILGGAVGFKPSYGICSRIGVVGLIPSMECVATISSSPLEAAKVIDAIKGYDENDFSMLKQGFPDFTNSAEAANKVKIAGIIKESLECLNPEERKSFDKSASLMKESGVETKELDMPEFSYFTKVHQVVGSVEASCAAGKYDSVRYGHRAEGTENWNEMYIKSRAESFGTLVKSFLFQGAYFQFKNYPAFEDAGRIRRRLSDQINRFFETVQVILFPVRTGNKDARKAQSITEVYEAFRFTCVANVTGVPAISLPGFAICGKTDLGLQIMAPHLEDALLIGFSEKVFKLRKKEE